MRDGRVTLLDVARHAGVSRTTASFVLAGRTDMRISAETADRVRRAARELSYRPNLLASSMRTGATKTVGFISDIVASEPFAGDMVRAAIEAALLHNHLVLVGETKGDPTVEDRVVKVDWLPCPPRCWTG